jgi:sugar phosphate isomerase/epimerase
MKLAIQEHLLPGEDDLARFQAAQRLGMAGVEVQAAGLTARLENLAAAIQATGVRVVAVNMGQQAGYLASQQPDRLQALMRVQQALADASDLMAENVVLIPHVGALAFTPAEANEMFTWFLRTVNDLAMAMDVTLCLQPTTPVVARFINLLSEAVQFCDAINRHPYVRIALDSALLATLEKDPMAALSATGELLRYVHLQHDRLPGQGPLDWLTIIDYLRSSQYDGWLTLASNMPMDEAAIAGSVKQLKL